MICQETRPNQNISSISRVVRIHCHELIHHDPRPRPTEHVKRKRSTVPSSTYSETEELQGTLHKGSAGLRASTYSPEASLVKKHGMYSIHLESCN